MGAAYIFLDPCYPVNRRLSMVRDARPAALIAPEPIDGLNVPLVRPMEDAQSIAGQADANINLSIKPDEPAYIIFTSGSTGQPKGTILCHRGLNNLVVALADVFAAAPGDRVLQYASLSFDASVFEMVMALSSGAALVVGSLGALLPGPGL